MTNPKSTEKNHIFFQHLETRLESYGGMGVMSGLARTTDRLLACDDNEYLFHAIRMPIFETQV